MSNKPLVGFIGWRGMVGSVLMQRLQEENDFNQFESKFFSTSNIGGKAPEYTEKFKILEDAFDIKKLSECEIIITCQGGDYTKEIFPKLRENSWQGHWIDAASTLRMKDDSVIVLDPVNADLINEKLQAGNKNWIGGNCTNSILLMGLAGLFKANLVEWVSSMTYQAASGGGANHMRELLSGMGTIYESVKVDLQNPASSILEIDKKVAKSVKTEVPTKFFGTPLAGNLIPWIDVKMDNGQSKEEWKGQAEVNKILGNKEIIPVDGLCVRIGAMRCHSLALTIKLKQNLELSEIEKIIKNSNSWVKFVDNYKDLTLKELTPANITGTLNVAVGRVRKLNFGSEYISCFVIGDQLLWGAAEPLRRMLRILLNN